MGIQDRDYAREPTGYERRVQFERIGFGRITAAITIVTVLVFLIRTQVPHFCDWMMCRPSELIGRGYVWQLFTPVFLHADFMHILFNMLLFWWAGKELERIYSPLDYLGLLLGSAASASILQSVWAYLPGGLSIHVPMIGASGMVMGVLVAFTALHPRTPTIFMGLPLFLVTAGYIVLDLVRGLGQADGIAHFAHLGGAAFGLAWWYWRLSLSGLLARLRGRSARAGAPARRKPRGRIVPLPRPGSERSGGGSRMSERDLEDASFALEVDAILEKIAREGQDALDDRERAVLEEAARRYRR